MLKSAPEPLVESNYFVLETEEDFVVAYGSSEDYEAIAYFASYDLADEYAEWKNETALYEEGLEQAGYDYEEEPDDISDLVDEFTKNSWE